MDIDRRRAAKAIAFVLAENEYGTGDVHLRGFEIIAPGHSRSFSSEDKERAPIVRVRLEDLLAVQDSVERKHLIHLLGAGWSRPVLVTPSPRGLILQDGHHRAYAAKLLGMKTILAKILPYPGTSPHSLQSRFEE